MTTRGVQFDPDGAKRIINGIKGLEKQIPHTGLKYNRANRPTLSNSGFWAMLTEADPATGKYSYTKVRPQADADFALYESPFIQDVDWGTGSKDDSEGFAYEATGSTECVLYDVVWIEPNGIENYYTFKYQPDAKWVRNQDEIAAVDDENEDEEKFSFATCDVFQFEAISGTQVQASVTADPAITLRAFNPSLSAIPADTFLKVCFMAGLWFVDLERCS